MKCSQCCRSYCLCYYKMFGGIGCIGFLMVVVLLLILLKPIWVLIGQIILFKS